MPVWLLAAGALTLVALAIAVWNLILRRRLLSQMGEVARRETQFRTLAENAPDAILRLDAQGTFRFANAACGSLLNLNPSIVMGRPLDQVGLPPDWLSDWKRNIEVVRRSGENLDSELNAEGRTLIGRWLPERDAQGQIQGVLVLWRDVTELRAAAEERQRIEQSLYQAQHWESLGVLAGAVAHDFKNHLAAIIGQAEAALGGGGAAAMEMALQQIRQRAEQAAETCRQLSTYSRSGGELEVMDPAALVADMTALLAASLPQGVDLQIACEPDLPAMEGDEGQIRQMIMSMTLNAASLLHGQQGVVLLRMTRTELPAAMLALREDSRGLAPGTYVLIEVCDNGPGLDEAGVRRLFEPYLAPDESGKGLGLAVARAVAMAHRGFLHASSVPGEGTTVQAFLPASSRSAEAAETPANAEVDHSGKILVIDDDPLVLDATSQMLEKAGWGTVTAPDGVQGLEKYLVHREEVSAVILDLNMPYMNGAETLKNLRASGCDCPVVVASGFSQLLVTPEMRRLGIAAFLEKPYSFDTLTRTMERVLNGARAGE